MTSPGESVREFYRRQGENRERARIIADLRARRREILRAARTQSDLEREFMLNAQAITMLLKELGDK